MAQGAKPKPKKQPKPKLRDKAQSERFIEAVRELGIENSSLEFENAVGKILTRKPIS
jgi:hypothetical protein